MIQRIACSMAFLVFALCLVVGGIQADNSFATTVGRAVVAMLATLVIGLILGAMARKMLDENLESEAEKIKKSSSPPATNDR
jgi:hypothetical protein